MNGYYKKTPAEADFSKAKIPARLTKKPFMAFL